MPGGVELDLVDPVAVAVVRAQHRLVALARARSARAPRRCRPAAPASRRRSTPQPPPSRSSASRSASRRRRRCRARAAAPGSVTSCVARRSCEHLVEEPPGRTGRGWRSRPRGAAVRGGQRADERLAERAHQRRGDGARCRAARARRRARRPRARVRRRRGSRVRKRSRSALDGRVDRLGDQRVGEHGPGERAAAEGLAPAAPTRSAAGRPSGAVTSATTSSSRCDGAPEHLGEQLALRGEVAVDGAHGHAGLGGHGLDPGRRVAALGHLRRAPRPRSARGWRACGPRSLGRAGRASDQEVNH